jgi:hypothetical protein
MADPIKTAEPFRPAAGEANGRPPNPSPEELADWDWLFGEIPTQRFDPYRGRYVAVFEKRVLGSGDQPRWLRQEVAAAHRIAPERLVVAYVEGLE